MDTTVKLVITVCVVFILLMAFFLPRSENYTSRGEKAHVIHNWFRKNGSRSGFENYRKEVEGSDIVEYTKVKKAMLRSDEAVTPSAIENLIS